MANKTFSDWLASLAQATAQSGDLIPIVQGGVSKKALAGQAGGPALLDAAGMVLDASGVKIVEYGSNANGGYVRFADGTQICWYSEEDHAVSAATLSIQGLTIYKVDLSWTFPAAFISPPTVLFGGRPKDGGYLTDQSAGVAPSATGISVITLRALNAFTTARLQYAAIGRWK